VVFFYFQWIEVRGDYSFCWYWQNCWPSLFKLSFNNAVFANLGKVKNWKILDVTQVIFKFSRDINIKYYGVTDNICQCPQNVMVSVLASSAVDRGFEPRSSKTKDYKIDVCCFSAKHTALRRKSKDWLARNQDHVSEWGDMSIRGLLFQWASTIKIQLSVLVWYKADLISLKIILFLPWYSWVGIKQQSLSQSLNAMKQ
jgi:hypothetical protein